MRCRPGEVSQTEGDPQRIAVAKACELVKKEGAQEGKDGEKWSVKGLAKEVGLTESHFCRVFKKIMGMTVGEYRTSIARKRRERAAEVVVPRKSALGFWEHGGPAPSFETPCLPNAVQAQDSFMDFNSDLALDWHEFSGTSHLVNALDMFPGVNGAGLGLGLGDFNFPLEVISDPSTPTTTDDGLQFLDFDAV